ncbi:MAG: LysM peptidoglycan-binding domain-containing protein [Limisphaerales bacterium]
MIFPACRRLIPGLLLLLLCAAGCIPTRDGTQDEQREPHFLRGQELRKQLDNKGAAEAFERALEANPRSASAHFELGLLFEQPLNDPATAIFHFERFLKLRPTSDRAEIVRQRVNNCKMELAKLFLIAPNAPSVQKEMDKLKTEVERLGLENNQLRRHVEALNSQAATRGVVPASAPAAVTVHAATAPAKKTAAPSTPAPSLMPVSARIPETPAAKPAKSPVPSTRTHAVKKGDIPETIARQYGVKLEALLAANPGLDPKRMKIGQAVTIPAP